MRIDKSKWSKEELIVFEVYDYKCVLCGGFQYADTLHHEPPRSLNPRWIDEPWTQFPLCAAHHDAVTVMPRDEAMELILHHVDLYAPHAIKEVKERISVTNSQ